MIEGSLFDSVIKKFSKQLELRDVVFNVFKKYVRTSKDISVQKTTITLVGVSKTQQKEYMFKEFELLEELRELTNTIYKIVFK